MVLNSYLSGTAFSIANPSEYEVSGVFNLLEWSLADVVRYQANMLSWVWPVPAWPANDRDENSDDIDPQNVVDLAAEEEGGAGAVSAAAKDGDGETESYLSDIGDA